MKKQKDETTIDELIIHLKTSVYDFYKSKNSSGVNLLDVIRACGYIMSETIVELGGSEELRVKQCEHICDYLMRSVKKMIEQEKNTH